MSQSLQRTSSASKVGQLASSTAQAQGQEQDQLPSYAESSSSASMPADYQSGYAQWDTASTLSTSTCLKDVEAGSRRSSIFKALEKAKSKLGHSGNTRNDEEELEKQKAKAAKKQERKEEYKRLGLDDRVKFGATGAGSFNSM